MKRCRFVVELASLALFLNGSGIAMAMSPPAVHSVPAGGVAASDAAHCAEVTDGSSPREPSGCCESGHCACVLHATIGAVLAITSKSLRAGNSWPGSAGITASPPIDDPLRPPIA